MPYHSHFSFLSGLNYWVHKGDIKNIYPELALDGSKNECAKTDNVFFLISEVCTSGVTLVKGWYHRTSLTPSLVILLLDVLDV